LGRHKNIKAADRICKICKDGVEDETHFLVKGKNFENIRKPYLKTIYTLCPNLKTCNNENIFIWIMVRAWRRLKLSVFKYGSKLKFCLNNRYVLSLFLLI
jgi:hypothetical protein